MPLTRIAARLVEPDADRADRLKAAVLDAAGAVAEACPGAAASDEGAIVEREIGDIFGVEQAGFGSASGSAPPSSVSPSSRTKPACRAPEEC